MDQDKFNKFKAWFELEGGKIPVPTKGPGGALDGQASGRIGGVDQKLSQLTNEQLQKLIEEFIKWAESEAEKTGQKVGEKTAATFTQDLEQQVQRAIEEAKERILKEAQQKAEETVAPKFEIKLPDPSKYITIEDEILAPQFETALKILNTLGILWLCGEAGCGKTHLAEQLAKSLDLPFYPISCTAGLSESWFIGRRDLTGEYLEPRFLQLVENGGVVLLDEFDATDPNTTLIINSLMSNNYLSVPMRIGKTRAERHKDFKIIFATNTWGFGPDGNYTGREGLDASTRDRAAVAKIKMTYSKEVEAAFIQPHRHKGPTIDSTWKAKSTMNHNIADIFYDIRNNIQVHKLRRIVSTRTFKQAAALRAVGFTDIEILSIYFADWTEQERAKGLHGLGIS